ncbi:MAG: TrmB family transcriptional regulator [Candidatus Kariarchaeaceae archaeon]|jgi:sugar-specific transcriptional regulator TrmB
MEDQTHRLLSELGLNEYETRAYLAVIEGGILVAREVSDRASIPYAKVYQTLNDLIEKQLIIGDEGRPKKFRPRNPEEAINDRLNSIQKDWEEAHGRRKTLIKSILPELNALYEESEMVEDEIFGVWNITGLTNIASRLGKMVQRAQANILVVTGNYESYTRSLQKIVFDNSQKPLTLMTTESINNNNYNQIIINDCLGPATQIIIDDIAMFSITEVQKGKYSAGEYTAVLTQIRELVSSARKTYEGMK